MNARERFLATLLFETPDRVPLAPGAGRRSTRAVWHGQGLPENVENMAEYAYRQAGGTLDWPQYGPGFSIVHTMIPQFTEKIIERKEHSQIVQDWKGNICEISNEYTLEYLRTPLDFVTRRWIKCPVETRDDWEEMKQRYDADDPTRLPADASERAGELMNRTWPVVQNFSGPFWQLREWLGFEKLCMLFIDDPEFVKEMIAFWQGFIARLLETSFQYVVPDMVRISEDMAYKAYSMISPPMVREFLLPTYRCWGEIIRGSGCPLYAVDSDGYVEALLPIWIEAGMNVCDPLEVAAGNDLPAFRRTCGKKMAYQGGVDKRAIAAGGTVIERELARLAPVIQGGGYIPGCDHGVPPDVSWPNYVYFVKLLARATGWL